MKMVGLERVLLREEDEEPFVKRRNKPEKSSPRGKVFLQQPRNKDAKKRQIARFLPTTTEMGRKHEPVSVEAQNRTGSACVQMCIDFETHVAAVSWSQHSRRQPLPWWVTRITVG